MPTEPLVRCKHCGVEKRNTLFETVPIGPCPALEGAVRTHEFEVADSPTGFDQVATDPCPDDPFKYVACQTCGEEVRERLAHDHTCDIPEVLDR